MKRLLVSCMVLVSVAFLSGVANAAPGDLSNAKIALHGSAIPGKGACSVGTDVFCSDDGSGTLNTNIPANTADVAGYVVVVDVDPNAGFQGAAFGVDYTDGGFYMNWTLCADQEFASGTWPGPQSGITVTYANCQNTPNGSDPEGEATVVLGYLYLYSYGDQIIQITPRLNLAVPDLNVTDCDPAGTDLDPSAGGSLGAGSVNGQAPCREETPVENTTWGSIKQFSGE